MVGGPLISRLVSPWLAPVARPAAASPTGQNGEHRRPAGRRPDMPELFWIPIARPNCSGASAALSRSPGSGSSLADGGGRVGLGCWSSVTGTGVSC